MPITFAHPAAIIPFARLRRESGWIGGLVAGSVAPDILQSFFGYLDRSPHSLMGWIALDGPLGLLLTWIAHYAITPRVRRMPGMHAIRATTRFSWQWAFAASMLGSGLHLVIDLFTHSESPLAQTGLLATPIAGPEWDPFLVSDLLWWVGSMAGTVAIVAWFAHRAWTVPGNWRHFLSWRWLAVFGAMGAPFVPLLHYIRLIYTPDLMEFVRRFTYLSDHMRIAMFASCFLGLATTYVVTAGRSKESETAVGETVRSPQTAEDPGIDPSRT